MDGFGKFRSEMHSSEDLSKKLRLFSEISEADKIRYSTYFKELMRKFIISRLNDMPIENSHGFTMNFLVKDTYRWILSSEIEKIPACVDLLLMPLDLKEALELLEKLETLMVYVNFRDCKKYDAYLEKGEFKGTHEVRAYSVMDEEPMNLLSKSGIVQESTHRLAVGTNQSIACLLKQAPNLEALAVISHDTNPIAVEDIKNSSLNLRELYLNIGKDIEVLEDLIESGALDDAGRISLSTEMDILEVLDLVFNENFAKDAEIVFTGTTIDEDGELITSVSNEFSYNCNYRTYLDRGGSLCAKVFLRSFLD